MFKKPKPHESNGLAEIIRQAENSKTLRNHAMRQLVHEIEQQRRRQKEAELNEYLGRAQRNGAL
jgi:hypothetical protein